MKKIFLPLFLSVLMLPTLVFAGNLNDAPNRLGSVVGKTGIDTRNATIESITGRAINTALSLVGIIFLGLMVYAGYLWLTARGEEGQVEKAKKIISTSIIGLVLVLGAYAITVLITSAFAR